jgi:hypothetical protein
MIHHNKPKKHSKKYKSILSKELEKKQPKYYNFYIFHKKKFKHDVGFAFKFLHLPYHKQIKLNSQMYPTFYGPFAMASTNYLNN